MNFKPSGTRCWAEISPAALRHNARLAADGGVPVIAVVKADAYGHGAVRVARILEDEVWGFAVANLDELRELREAGIDKPILVMSVVLPEERAETLKLNGEACVSSWEEAASWSALAQTARKPMKIHWAVDTGMGRTGFFQKDWTSELVKRLLSLPGLHHAGLGSHFPNADEDPAFTKEQIRRFTDVVRIAREAGLNPDTVHMANSGGIRGFSNLLRGLCTHARAGLMLYGVDPLHPKSQILRSALTWKCRVSLVRDMPAAHGVCYGSAFVTPRPMRVATLTVGYADGLSRHLSNHHATVLVRGHSCPVLGRITMDQTVIDVSALPDPPVAGDEAILIGGNDTDQSVEDMASKAGTIAWEIFTNLSRRVRRYTAET